jgi:antirestriction protein ArdC
VVDRARFGCHDYSEEELVAEMGSAFLCSAAGILPQTIDNAAAYLHSWIRVLKGDARLVVRAGSAAQRADWLLQRTPERKEEPAA